MICFRHFSTSGAKATVKISNLGRKQNAFGVISSPKPSFGGYCRVHIFGKNYYMHILVCTLFNGPRPTSNHTVHHINKVPSDNHASNLRWATVEEQRFFQDRLPMHNNPMQSKPVIAWKHDDTKEVTQVSFDSQADACRKLGISISCINKCCSGKRKSAHGYKFRVDTDRMESIEPHMIEGEEWRAILDGRTQVSSFGRYRSKFGIVSRPRVSQEGYVSVHIEKKLRRLHTLICEAWHGPKPTPNHTVDHINGIRSDNRPENLRWATRREQSLNQRPRDRTSISSCKPVLVS